MLALRLKELRERNGIKQVEVVAQLKRPHSFPNKVESAQRSLDPIELMDYVEAIGGDYLTFISEFTNEVKAMRIQAKSED